MKTISRSTFSTVKTEGALLPADLLQKIAEGKVAGLQPQDYHLGPSERLNEAINRAWNRLLGVWQAFQAQQEQLDQADNGFALTRDRWLRILFQELGYGRLLTQRAMKLPNKQEGDEEQSFPINHCWENVPIHMTSFRQPLDSRDPALRRSPHSLLQEFINRSADHQWGFVSNGFALRILRDNASLTRAAFVEFDLAAMMSGEQYADFSLLWLLCHQSRVETITPAGELAPLDLAPSADDEEDPQVPTEPTAQAPTCWLEQWSQTAVVEGTRALDELRQGVQAAIEALGQGFLRQSSAQGGNRVLKGALQQGSLSKQDYYRQLLRMVYRLIFLLVAEDRDLLLLPDTPDAMQARYRRFYSVGRLRALAAARRGSPHPDLYRGLRLLFGQLRDGYAPLGLPALGSFLFSAQATPLLDQADLANYDLLHAIRALTAINQGNVRRVVDFKNLGAEELGSVYESLLELEPELSVDAATFALRTVAGSERKTTGSYYTPTVLITCLLDSALEPVVADRLANCHSDDRREEESRFPRYRHSEGVPATEESRVRPSRDSSPSAQNDNRGRLGRDSSPSAQNDRSNSQNGKRSAREAAILAIKVVDPACGSGHFLIAAANRLALHLARVRTGDDEPSPAERRSALREVVHHCIHGVDINPMSVELCKVALWMETLDPGKPLGFLDRNIQCGNSLLGATPALLRRGIPDDAFKPILGDDNAYVSRFKKQNKAERQGRRSLLDPSGRAWRRWESLAACMVQVDRVDDSTVAAVRRQEALYEECTQSSDYAASRLWADGWCAAFVWVKKEGVICHSEEANADEESHVGSNRDSSPSAQNDNQFDGFPYPITEEIFRQLETDPAQCTPWMAAEIVRLREQYQFFHWHLAFPHIFQPKLDELEDEDVTGWTGGFDVVLGNPPWERIKIQEKEWFATRDPAIAGAPNAAARRQLIADLANDNPTLLVDFEADKRKAEGDSHLVRDSSRYPLCGRGDVNTYTIFAELVRHLIPMRGRSGIIVPSGIATDDTTKFYFQDIMERSALVSLYDFENRNAIFPGVHRSYKFCLLTLRSNKVEQTEPQAAEFVFFAHQVSDLRDSERRFGLTADEIALLNPNTRTCPIFRSRRDAKLTKAIYRRSSPFLVGNESVWASTLTTQFHSSNDAHRFEPISDFLEKNWLFEKNGLLTQNTNTARRLYEGKMFALFDHRAATVVLSEYAVARQRQSRELTLQEHQNPAALALSFYGVQETHFDLPFPFSWMLCFKKVTSATNERTLIASVLPPCATNDSIHLILPKNKKYDNRYACLLADTSSFLCDFVCRQKLGGVNLNFYIFEQIPVQSPKVYTQRCTWLMDQTLLDWLLPSVLELTYTAYDLQPFAQDCGYYGPPFRWDVARRFLLRCELDAAYFHLYSIERDDVAYIMETFPIVKRKDLAAHGEYRTQRVILEIYDAMAAAIRSGQPSTGLRPTPYQTRLDPPPADPAAAHPWDETYLGPAQPPATWWREGAAVSPATGEDGVVYAGQTPVAKVVNEPTTDYSTVTVGQESGGAQLGLLGLAPTVFPPPTGDDSARLKRVRTLATSTTSEDQLRELAAFLADASSNIRWLAGATLLQRGGPLVLTVLADFMHGAAAERQAVAQPELVRILEMLAATAEAEEVRGRAQALLEELTAE